MCSGEHISLGIYVRGNTYPRETHITVTPDALVAVVVAARQNLWVEVVLVADGASYLLAQFLHSLLDRIGTFRHRNSDTQQTLAAVSILTKAESTPDLQSKRGVSGTPRFGNGNETVRMRTYRTAITSPDSSLLLTRTPSPITQAS